MKLQPEGYAARRNVPIAGAENAQTFLGMMPQSKALLQQA
jgi:hypothetical protein